MLCCIGDLVEDIVVWPSSEPTRGTDTSSRIFRTRGGSAATVAVHAAAVGVATRFVGQVGNDPLGEALVRDLESAGVEVVVTRHGRTGSVVVLVDETGERTMLPDRGAATALTELPVGALDGVSWLHVPAYSLVVEPLATTSITAVTRSRELGATVSVDASSTGPLQHFGVDRFLDLLAQLGPDVFFCNRDEAATLGLGPDHGMAGMLTVRKSGADPVVITDERGTVVTVPVPAVSDVADTTGAGDAFAAGFIAASMQGATPAVAAEAGIGLAATVLTRPGG